MNFKDLTGQKFNRLTAIKYVGNSKWLFKCDCGKEIIVRTADAKSGNTKSCGCLQKETQIKNGKLTGYINGKKNIKHNLSNSRLYRIYAHIKERCTYPKCIDYKNYGGRGIKMCEEWLKDFKSFYDWAISHGYKDNLTIDRIDNNGNYEPNNCRWTSRKIQCSNKRNNHLIVFNNKTQTVTQWAKEFNVLPSLFINRLKRGWSVEKTLTTPLLR